jgi:hypothetical protein
MTGMDRFGWSGDGCVFTDPVYCSREDAIIAAVNDGCYGAVWTAKRSDIELSGDLISTDAIQDIIGDHLCDQVGEAADEWELPSEPAYEFKAMMSAWMNKWKSAIIGKLWHAVEIEMHIMPNDDPDRTQ